MHILFTWVISVPLKLALAEFHNLTKKTPMDKLYLYFKVHLQEFKACPCCLGLHMKCLYNRTPYCSTKALVEKINLLLSFPHLEQITFPRSLGCPSAGKWGLCQPFFSQVYSPQPWKITNNACHTSTCQILNSDWVSNISFNIDTNNVVG